MMLRRISEKEFEAKYKLYSQMVFNIAYSYFKSVAVAEDIVQDVFLKYLKQCKFNCENHEKYWLIRVTINHCKNVIKKRNRVVLVDNDYINSFSDVANISNENDKFSDLILNLNPIYRNVIILYYYHDLSVKEIAKVLKISDSAVKMRLSRAREMLKEMEMRNNV